MTADEALAEAMRQQAADPEHTLAERVEALPVGTQFTETDDIGRTHRMMRVFGGRCLIDNGNHDERPWSYGDRYDDGYSIVVDPPDLTPGLAAAEKLVRDRIPGTHWAADAATHKTIANKIHELIPKENQ